MLRSHLILVTNPLLVKSRNIDAHRSVIKQQKLNSELKSDFYKCKDFNVDSDIITENLSKSFEYKNSITIYSKNISALHTDADNSINCLVNIDNDNSIFGTIVLDDDNKHLKCKRVHNSNTNDILSFHNITNIFKAELKPGYMLIFNSNYYHSFDCGTGTRLIVHKFKNHFEDSKSDPIYI